MDPSPSFTFLPPPPPLPPNPNPSINPANHRHHIASAALPNQPNDLHTTLSALKHLIRLSKTTIHSLSNLIPSATTSTTSLATCPYNSNHRVPPNSLFHHHLQCPSSPAPVDISLLDSLHYPNSLQYPLSNKKNNCLPQTLPDDQNTDLCFSLHDYDTSLDSNFFYRDCPAVVTFPCESNNADRKLTLPAELSAECATDDMSDTIDGLFSNSYLSELLPSEHCNIRTELNQWNDYPSFYSYSVLRSIACCYISRKEYLIEWILVNSPFYGVVIDVYMRDHVLLLFRLCFKAIIREAIGYLVSISKGDTMGGKYRFDCPVLLRVLTWLASQLAILYGEVNGKLFAVNMLKQSLLIASSTSLFLYGEQRVSASSGLSEVNGKVVPLKGSKESDGSRKAMVLVSQVAAAVAALHERSMLETRIKAIHASRVVPVYQRVQEHECISKKAEEERRKRPNYKPIIEHDGVLWHRGDNQDANKNKSREELLAEERDYKRRRMSYRGKKIKRSTTQVMRDIIDEYMEEIKHANMVGQPPVDKANKEVPQSHGKESVSDTSMRCDDEIKGKSYKNRQDRKREEHYIIDDSSRHMKKYGNTDVRRSISRSHDHGKRDYHEKSRKYKDRRSSSIVQIEFEDRYDPSKSHHIDDDGDGDL